MIMMGIEFTGKPPFETVYLHGLVRDAQVRSNGAGCELRSTGFSLGAAWRMQHLKALACQSAGVHTWFEQTFLMVQGSSATRRSPSPHIIAQSRPAGVHVQWSGVHPFITRDASGLQ
jgi:hypothetical protein